MAIYHEFSLIQVILVQDKNSNFWYVNHVFGVHRTFPIQKKDTSQHAQAAMTFD